MQMVRTVTWIVVTAILVGFVAMNWERAQVNFWPLEENYLHFEWPVGFIAIVFFLLGFVPMWMLNRAQGWRASRRIAALENSLRAAAAVSPSPSQAEPAQPTPAATEPGTTDQVSSDRKPDA